jgi:hypothetical protein
LVVSDQGQDCAHRQSLAGVPAVEVITVMGQPKTQVVIAFGAVHFHWRGKAA